MIMELISRPEYDRFTAADREKRLQWFKEARFGMFIHYSLFSQHETGEWCMYQQEPKQYILKLEGETDNEQH